MRFLKVLLILILFIFGLLFFTQNAEVLSTPLTLKLSLYFQDWKWDWQAVAVPFFFVVLLAFAAGAGFTLMFFFLDKTRATWAMFTYKRTIRIQNRDIKRLKDELERLNAAPKAIETTAKQVSKDTKDASPVDKPA